MKILIFNVENHHSTDFFLSLKNVYGFFFFWIFDIKTLDTWYAGICRIFWWQKSILYVQNMKEYLNNT